MKTFIILLVAVAISMSWCIVAQAIDNTASGFREMWHKSHENLTSYPEVLIFSIDLRGLNVEKTGRHGKMIKAPFEEQMLMNLGESFYHNLRDAIQPVMQVNKDDESGKHVTVHQGLLMNIKLDGIFSVSGSTERPQSQPSVVTVTFSFRNGSTNKDIVTLIDFQECSFDENSIKEIIKDWAHRCALFINGTKPHLEPESEPKPSTFFEAPILLPR